SPSPSSRRPSAVILQNHFPFLRKEATIVWLLRHSSRASLRREQPMRRLLSVAAILMLDGLLAGPAPVESACCYFAAKDKDILQPAQKAFITWDPVEQVE